MKNFTKIILGLSVFSLFFCFSYAQEGKRTNWGSSPMQVFENVVGAANTDEKIQETALDDVTNLQGSYPSRFKISNTLDSVRQNINVYLQRAIYIGFTVSTAGLIICGFLLVTGGVGKTGGFEKVKGKIINALLGVFVLSGFYILIKLMMSLINTFFNSN